MKKLCHLIAVHQNSKLAVLKHRWRLPFRILRQIFGDCFRGIRPAPHTPKPDMWSDNELTAAWLGHSTVLMNFHGLNIITDPVFSDRAGIFLGVFTLGPKRRVKPALKIHALPRIDLILLSHAHMDHLDLRSLRSLGRLNPNAMVVTAKNTADLLAGMKFRKVIELDWEQSATVETGGGEIKLNAFKVRHWGARMRHDDHRGYNGYMLERKGRKICFTGDTAFTPLFEKLRTEQPIDLMLAPIGAYHPWITSHCNPEEAVQMADMAGARYIMPIHHQTFKLSWEPMDEPIERFTKALAAEPERVALREIGETFVAPEVTALQTSSRSFARET